MPLCTWRRRHAVAGAPHYGCGCCARQTLSPLPAALRQHPQAACRQVRKTASPVVCSQQVINATMYKWMSHIPTPTVSPLPLSTLAMAPTNGIGVVAMARECFPGKSLRGQAAFYRGRRGTAAPLCNPSALKHVSELRPDIPRVRCLVSRGDASRAAHGSRADAPPRRREGFIGWRRR